MWKVAQSISFTTQQLHGRKMEKRDNCVFLGPIIERTIKSINDKLSIENRCFRLTSQSISQLLPVWEIPVYVCYTVTGEIQIWSSHLIYSCSELSVIYQAYHDRGAKVLDQQPSSGSDTCGWSYFGEQFIPSNVSLSTLLWPKPTAGISKMGSKVCNYSGCLLICPNVPLFISYRLVLDRPCETTPCRFVQRWCHEEGRGSTSPTPQLTIYVASAKIISSVRVHVCLCVCLLNVCMCVCFFQSPHALRCIWFIHIGLI